MLYKVYIDLYKCYIKEYFWRNPNVLKFAELLNNDNKVVVLKLITKVYMYI